MEREAMLYETLPGGRVRCHVCQWRCLINPGKLGVCRVRINRDGKLYSMNYAEVPSMAADHIEKKPLFHFFPGTYAFSLGTWGGIFHCKGCQNWEISCVDIPQGLEYHPSAENRRRAGPGPLDRLVERRREPTIWFE